MARIRIWRFTGDPLLVISAPDAFLVRSQGMALDTVDVVVAEVQGEALIHGAYERPKAHTYLRRLTGGPLFKAHSGDLYIAVIRRYQWRLDTLLKDHSKLVSCMGGGDAYGGQAGDAVYGVTKIAGKGVAEVLAKSRTMEDALKCVERLGRIAGIEELDEDLIPGKALERNRDPGWLRPPRQSNVWSYSTANGYRIGFHAWVEEGLIHWIEVDGNFHAAPPSQVYALIDTVEQVYPSPGLAYEFTAAWSTFVDTAGISIDNVSEAFNGLLRRVEALGGGL